MKIGQFRFGPDDGTDGGDGGDGGNPPEPAGLDDARMNRAISSHMTRLKKSMGKEVQDMISQALGPITERLSKFEPTPQPPAGDGDGQNADLAEKIRKSVQAEYDKRFAELERKSKEAEERALSEQRRRETDEERARLTESLRSAGVSPAQLRGAVSLIYTEDKRIGRDENGDVVYKVQRSWGEENIPLEEGITEWLKTDEGKGYLPAVGASGSGATGSRARSRGQNPKEARLEEARAILSAYHGMEADE